MNPKRTLRHVGIALMLLVAFLVQGTWALAGTTGGISGTVSDEKGAAVVDATVTVSAPSGTSTATTDGTGHFTFLTLAPDTYTVSASKTGYDPVSQGGVSVFADQTQTVALKTEHSIKEIGHVTSKAANDLVKSGTTSDVYSVNAATAEKVAAIGGGANLNNAYSALASQPGVYVGYGGMGWGQTIYIHGASYSQVGYEFDGVPVNRAFDNYNANTLTNLGQQELQVYTGGAQSASSSSTVGGFINQVIRTGTYPGFGLLEAGVGVPSYYHQLHGEAGGATPNRLFSYYVGLLGYDQNQRIIDQFNGGDLLPGIQPTQSTLTTKTANFPGAFPFCNADGSDPRLGAGPPNPGGGANLLDQGCVGGPFPAILGNANQILQDREAVMNIHIGIPHHHDSGRDDVQLLYNGSYLRGFGYDSINDYGGLNMLNTQLFGNNPSCAGCSPIVPVYKDGIIAQPGVSFGQPFAFGSGAIPTQTYFFPSSPTNRAVGSPIPNNLRDATENDAQVFKVQYTHNMGSNAYIRVFGYSFYSDWLQNGPAAASLIYTTPNALFEPFALDYELITHTKGGELQFADQLNSQNLLTATANYTTANVARYNNSTFTTELGTGATSLVDPNGNCYTGVIPPGSGATLGAPTTCYNPSLGQGLGNPGGTFANPAPNPVVGQALAAGAQYDATFLGPNGTLNKVSPKFSSYSITDQWRPSDKFLLNVGARLEQFTYDMASASGPDFNFWFKAAQNDYCYDPANGDAPVVGANRAFNTAPLFVGLTCPNSPISGQPTLHPNGQNGSILYTNAGPPSYSITKFEPRLSGTYTFDPDSVLRFSVGRYANPFNTATVQYLNASAKGAATFDFQNFFGLGFTSTFHGVQPAVSTNADLSFEHRMKGTDVSFKLSPFYRYVTDQTQDFFIGPGFVSAIPDGNETAYGVEFQLNKGDPNKNGLSGQLSYTYTHATTKFNNLANGTNAIDPINGAIDAYNGLTSTGNRFGSRGAVCYNNNTAAGPNTPAPAGDCNVVNGQIVMTPGGIAAGDVINPYFLAAAQPLLDRGAAYPLYQSIPNPLSNPGFPDSQMSILWPNVFAGFVNYRHNKFSITPNFQLIDGFNGGSSGGGQYGSPLTSSGLDPRVCFGNQGQAGVTTVNPGFANFTQCGNSLNSLGIFYIPNPYTGRFDNIGQYSNPWLLNLNAQIRYDISPKLTANLVLANIYNRCFGGTSTAWSSANPPGGTVCGYDTNTGFAGTQPGAGFFNGTSVNDPANGPNVFSQNIKYPYTGLTSFLPFAAYFTLQIKF